MIYRLITLVKTAVRYTMLFLLTLLTYLLQVCVLDRYLNIGSITPNLMMAFLAVVAVGFGRLRAFWCGAVLGLLLEVMQPSQMLLNLLLYPVCALFTAYMFASKTPAQLEYERSIGKSGRNLSPYLRVMCASAVNITICEVINLVYIYLRGTDISGVNIGRALISIASTLLITLPVLFVLRRPFGIVRKRASVSASPYVEELSV